MAHRTIGIEIGEKSIHLVQCYVTETEVTVERQTHMRLPEAKDDKRGSLHEITNWVYSDRGHSIDAIGQTVDSTSALIAHKVFALNDPRVIDKVLDMTMADTWTITPDTQLSFEIGEFVKAKSEEDEDGYDVTVLNYPKSKLQEHIDLLKPNRLDPHVMLPELQAIKYAVERFLNLPSEPCALIDIGSNKASLTIVDDNKITMSRAFMLGSARIDESLAQALNITPDEAETLKCSSGFLAMPGEEMATYEKLVGMNEIVPLEDTSLIPTITASCANGISMLFTAIHQSLMGFVTKTRKEPMMIYIMGGGSQLPGLEDWMTRQMGVPCTRSIPLANGTSGSDSILLQPDFSMDALCAAIAAATNIDSACSLNLRRRDLAHKGSLEYLKDSSWVLASLILLIILSASFLTATRFKTINTEHAQIKAALEQASESTFGKKMTNLKTIKKEMDASKGYTFLPNKTAFEHFEWLSNEITMNLSDVDLELSQLDIDTQRKIVTLRGEVGGDDGLPKFMQLLEQYECFPNEIAEPKTSKIKERTAFTLRVEANHCSTGGGDDDE